MTWKRERRRTMIRTAVAEAVRLDPDRPLYAGTVKWEYVDMSNGAGRIRHVSLPRVLWLDNSRSTCRQSG